MCAPTNVYVFIKFKRNQSFKGNKTPDANNNPHQKQTSENPTRQKGHSQTVLKLNYLLEATKINLPQDETSSIKHF